MGESGLNNFAKIDLVEQGSEAHATDGYIHVVTSYGSDRLVGWCIGKQ